MDVYSLLVITYITTLRTKPDLIRESNFRRLDFLIRKIVLPSFSIVLMYGD